jgi:hypothetical protein
MSQRTLYVPIHLPLQATHAMIERELKYREVVSFKTNRSWIELVHEPMCHESKAELLSCIESPIIV